MGQVLLLLNAEHFARVLQILSLCVFDFLRGSGTILFLLLNSLDLLLLLGLSNERLLVIQTVVVEIVSDRNEKVEHVALAFTMRNQDRHLCTGRNQDLGRP